MHPLNLVVAIAVVMFILKQNKQTARKKKQIQTKLNQNNLETSDVIRAEYQKSQFIRQENCVVIRKKSILSQFQGWIFF